MPPDVIEKRALEPTQVAHSVAAWPPKPADVESLLPMPDCARPATVMGNAGIAQGVFSPVEKKRLDHFQAVATKMRTPSVRTQMDKLRRKGRRLTVKDLI